jgi:type IV pilus assembly protein PilB
MRLLEKNTAVPSLEELGLSGLPLKRLMESIKIPRGIVLITGPTGSGKTTTLYSILHEVNTPKVNIMTVEDPVEYQVLGVSQVQVNPQAGMTFANGLRSFLRQDPDIIMVGEIRDSETAALAVQASLTGHLVFSTLHTSSAAGAMPRLLDMGVEAFLLASTITMIVAQRVVRRIHPDYKEQFTPDPAMAGDVKAVLGDRYLQWCQQNNKDPNNMVLYRPSDKRPTTEPDYLGRIGIFEVLPITEQISHMIIEGKTDAEIERAAVSAGMLLMKQDGYIKALEGVTTIEEVLRVAEA